MRKRKTKEIGDVNHFGEFGPVNSTHYSKIVHMACKSKATVPLGLILYNIRYFLIQKLSFDAAS